MAMGTEYKLAIRIAGNVDPSVAKSAQQASGILGSIVKADLIASGIKTAGRAVAGFVGDAVDTYSTFNQSMANTAAIAGATGDAYAALNDAARQAGKETTFTAAEAADALGYMALAGWDVEQSTTALTPVLKLAEATQADLATTSDQVTDSMSAMGVGIEDLDKYLDVLIKTNNSANTTAADLMEAFIGAGGAVQAAGMNFQDASVALGILANNGIKGAEAGTALNSILVRMTTKDTAKKAYKQLGVAVYDAAGEMRDMKDILVDVNAALDGMTDAEKDSYVAAMAGTNYYSDFMYLLNGVTDAADGTGSAWDGLADAVYNANGALDTMDKTVTDTYEGKMARLNSALDDVKLGFMDAFGDDIQRGIVFLADTVIPNVASAAETAGGWIHGAADATKRLYDYVTDANGASADFSAWVEKNETALQMAAIATGALATALLLYNGNAIIATVSSGAETAAIWAMCAADTAATAATTALGTAVAFLTSPFTLAVAAIAGAIAIGVLLYKNWDAVKDKAVEISSVIQTNFRGMWDGLVSMGKTSINSIIGFVNGGIGAINGMSFSVPSWVPGIGGKTVGFNIPEVPMLAAGGIATRATLAEIGEGSEPEAVLPLSKLAAMLGINRDGGSIQFAPTIYVNGGNRGEVEAAVGEAFEEFKRLLAEYERDRRRKAFA